MNYRNFFKEDVIPGGKGDKKSPKDVCPKELSAGIKVEMEHTKDAKLAREIAMDHLTEDPEYYSKLKHAGLADELKEDMTCGLGNDRNFEQGDRMAQAAGLASMNPQEPNNGSIVEPDTKSVDKQTVQGTVFPPVSNDPANGANMSGCIGNTKNISNSDKTNVDAQPKDPQPTDHITGAMGSTPSNPKILSKQSQQMGGGSEMMQQMMTAIVPKDISIDIAESKKLLKKMIKENVCDGAFNVGDAVEIVGSDKKGRIIRRDSKSDLYEVDVGEQRSVKATPYGLRKVIGGLNPTVKGSAKAFQPSEGFAPAAGDPDTDSEFVKGKRWTVSSYNRNTPKMK